jgi:molybdate transport system substrate-binding protein
VRLPMLQPPPVGGRPLAVAVLLLALVGCGSAARGPGPTGGDGGELSGEVTVFAAASLTEAFTEVAETFERAHPGVDVTLNFGSSSALAQQILAGAPADVFAAASPATMATVTGAGDAAEPRVFARNTLQIAVPPGNPGKVADLADFADEERTLALCAEQVPCGAAAKAVFAAAGLRPSPDTLEQDVKAALSKVRLGEVDAALVYRTDVLAAGDDVEGIGFPEADAAVNDYPIAILPGAPHPAAAAAFSSLVLSDEAQSLLADAGFVRP